MAHLKKPSSTTKPTAPPLPSQLKGGGGSSNRPSTSSSVVTPSTKLRARTPSNPKNLPVPSSVRSNATPRLQQGSGNANFQTPGGGGGGGGGGAGPQRKVMTEEQQLRREYTLYLQAGMMNMLTKRFAAMDKKVALDKIGKPGCSGEIENILKVRNFLLQYNTWLEMMDSLMKTNKMADIFLDLKHQFSDDKTKTLNGMRISLENRFNQIWLGVEDSRQGETGVPAFPGLSRSSDDSKTGNNNIIKIATVQELHDLAERVKHYISKLDDDDDEKSWSDENPQFIVSFIDALTQIVDDHDVITSNNKEGDVDVETNVEAMSSMISSQAVAKRNKKRSKKNNKKLVCACTRGEASS